MIELIGDTYLSEKIIINALEKGWHVVTTNKLLIADKGIYPSKLASQHDARLLYSAAVAGAIPILEILTHYKKIRLVKKLNRSRVF